jgi:four helix bundle protein
MDETKINSYRDLKVWQHGMDIAESCYRLTRLFPKEELYGLTSQTRRAAVSIPANIAEGHGRDTRREYIKSLRVAQGSLKELETHLLLAARVEVTTNPAVEPHLDRCDEIGKMLRALIRALQAAQG